MLRKLILILKCSKCYDQDRNKMERCESSARLRLTVEMKRFSDPAVSSPLHQHFARVEEFNEKRTSIDWLTTELDLYLVTVCSHNEKLNAAKIRSR